MNTRVFLVDDHRLFLSGVQAELASASTWSARPPR